MNMKDKFNRYERVRRSGVTNMFDVKVVQELSGLSREEIFDIMENYGKYSAMYMEGKK